MFKRKSSVAIVIGLLLLLVLFACGRKGTLNPNEVPVIEITSYAGVEPDDPDFESVNEIVFQQRIHWFGHVADGSIDGYAFRVIKFDPDNPEIPGDNVDESLIVATHGWDVVDSNGWVYHFKPGLDVGPEASLKDAAPDEITIWSKLPSARINFPADGAEVVDSDGNIVHTPIKSWFQVKCISERGEESSVDSRLFFAKSQKPSVEFMSPFVERIIGRGGKFEFDIDDPDNNIAGVNALASEFQFAFLKGTYNDILNTYDIADDDYGMVELVDGVPTNYENWEWVSTKDERDINIIRLPIKDYYGYGDDFVLRSNIDDLPEGTTSLPSIGSLEEENHEATFIFMRVIDLANVKSNVEVKKFWVYGNFNPETIIFLNDTFILGQNHFQPVYEPGMLKVIPSQQTAAGVRFSRRFWRSLPDPDDPLGIENRRFEVIGSEDIRFYFHWGWKGEYLDPMTGLYNHPWDLRVAEVHDRVTGMDYNSEITHFHVRMNDEPIAYPPVPLIPGNIHTDEDGTEWLKVSRQSAFFKNLIISSDMLTHSGANLYGTHVLEVRAVDLQGAVDTNHPVFEFDIVRKVEPADKNGILLINNASTQQALVKETYEEILLELNQDNIRILDYRDLTQVPLPEFFTRPHRNRGIVSPTEMQNYKLVIFNNDVEPHSGLNETFQREYPSLYLYTHTGGNLVVSGGSNLYESHVSSFGEGYYPFHDFFGVGNNNIDDFYRFDDRMAGSPAQLKPYFIGASPDNSFNTVLHLELSQPIFSANFLNATQGLGPIAQFNSFSFQSEIIYRYVSKEPSNELYHPDVDWYDEYNGFPVALKQVHDNGSKCYLFGFPLLYMELDGVKALYQEIWNDLD